MISETRKRIDKWSGRKQNNCTKTAGAHPRQQFSVNGWGKGLKIYTEISNVLETIRMFQKQFSNRNVYFCPRPCSNLNHTGHTYRNCP